MFKNLKDYNYKNYNLYSDGSIYSLFQKRILRGWIDIGGYRRVALTNNQGIQDANISVHRLVAKVFLPEAMDGQTQVNHIDGNKLNNSFTNLEWTTPSENSQHAHDIGLVGLHLKTKDTKVPNNDDIIFDNNTMLSILDITEEDVHNICYHLQEGYRVCDVSKMLAVDRRFIQHLRDGQKMKWKYITDTYDFSKIKRKERTSPETVLKICEYLENSKGINQISKELDIDRKLVSNIKNRKYFLDLSADFSFWK